MKIKVIQIGKNKFSELESLIDLYKKRTSLAPQVEVERVILKDTSSESAINLELFSKEKGFDLQNTYFLAEWGREYKTSDFIELLKAKRDDSQDVAFVIAGAHGWQIDQQFGAKYKFLSLSQMVFNHELAQVLLWEQLYRFTDSLKGGKYAK
jgi:23S rRNA pseudoU1915 N3-methylase RlmH